jgi:MFS transporter, DHA3 family, multidrug efflux protein
METMTVAGEDTTPGERRTFFHVLANTLVASVVNFTVWFAVTFFVYLETRSVFATGVIAGVYLGLTALSGICAGTSRCAPALGTPARCS